METAELEVRVKKVIGAVLKVDPETIGSNDHFVFDLGADSIGLVELMMQFI